MPALFEQGKRAVDVSTDEVIGPENGAVNVAFGGEMDDGARLVKLEQATPEFAIANVSLYKTVSRIGGNAEQVARVAGVSKFVEIDYRSSLLLKPLQDEVGANEARPSRNKDRLFHENKARAGSRRRTAR